MLSSVFLLAALVSVSAAGASFAADARGPARGQRESAYFTDRGQLNYARFLLAEGEFLLAAREFDRVIEDFPTSTLKPESQFGKAEAYLKAGQYRDAERVLMLFIENFGEGPLKGEAGRMILEARRLERAQRAALKAAPPGKSAQARPVAAMNAVQVALFEGLDLSGIDSELRRLKNSGVDTVIIRVFHNRGDRFHTAAGRATGADSGVYFRTSHAPVIADLLAPLVEISHRRGLKIFAWMTTRYADYGLEGDAELACTGVDLSTGFSARCRGLDLFNEKAVRHLEALYSDLAEYAMDGILFQDDLVLRHTEGFGAHARRLFKEESGLDADPALLYLQTGAPGRVHYTPLFWKWASWKNARLLYVAARLKAKVREKRPGVEFAVNMMYESVTNPPYALAWLSQDLKKAVEQGFEYYSIMAYHRQMGEELGRDTRSIRELIERMVIEAAGTVGRPEKVLMKVQIIDWKTGVPLPDSEVVPLLRVIRAAGEVSLAVVPYRGDFPFNEISGKGRYALLD